MRQETGGFEDYQPERIKSCPMAPEMRLPETAISNCCKEAMTVT